MKKFLSMLLCFGLLCGCVGAGSIAATADSAFSTPGFFSDYMLFQQKKPMNVWGKATAGHTVKGELYKTGAAAPLETVEATAGEDGSWSLAFSARAGGYDSYRLTLYDNGAAAKTIEEIVIGELWLATGQSNMEYPLDRAVGGQEAMNNANDKYLRVLLMPNDPVGLTAAHPARPTYDIANCRWGWGASAGDISGMAALAYFAAQELRANLNVPVGIINAALGATSIQVWLSRESIDHNLTVKRALEQAGLYRTERNFTDAVQDYRMMTAMYNTKIGPLAGMNLSGVFWCQGETNRDGLPSSTGYYTAALETLAECYSDTFGFEKGDIPVMVINIACHPYKNDPQNIPKWIEEVADAAAIHPNIMNIPLYDVPLTYKDPPAENLAYPIHPNNKELPGRRAGLAAVHNVYGVGEADYYAPTVKRWQVRDGAVYVTFDHVAKGLDLLEDSIGVHGFTLAAEDGFYLPARAQIVAADTVKVWHDSIEAPRNFTYAFNSYAVTANLCNSYGLPAVPYRSNRETGNYRNPYDWMYCDDTEVWVTNGTTADYQLTWHSSALTNAEQAVTINTDVRYEGVGSVQLSYTLSGAGTAGASVFFGQNMMTQPFGRTPYLSIMLRNDDDRDKTVRLLLGKAESDDSWLVPMEGEDGAASDTCVVKANSDFTRYNFRLDLRKPYNTAEDAHISQPTRLEVLVEDTESGSLYVDDITIGDVAPRPLTPYETVTLGDVDDNGAVNAADALLCLQYAVGKTQLTSQQQKAANVNKDGAINAADALEILKKAVGKPACF